MKRGKIFRVPDGSGVTSGLKRVWTTSGSPLPWHMPANSDNQQVDYSILRRLRAEYHSFRALWRSLGAFQRRHTQTTFDTRTNPILRV